MGWTDAVENLTLFTDNTGSLYLVRNAIYGEVFRMTGSREKTEAAVREMKVRLRKLYDAAIQLYKKELREDGSLASPAEKDAFLEHYVELYYGHDVQSMVERLAVEAKSGGQSRIASNKISADESLRALLASATVQDNVVTLNLPRIDQKTYAQIKKVMCSFGGKWVTSLQGFRFKDDPSDMLASILETGIAALPEDYSFFATPKPHARHCASLLSLEPGMKVLEPQAGSGRLADAAAEIVGIDNVHCYEIQDSLRESLAQKGYTVLGGDFLSAKPEAIYDAVIMNPPFENHADIKHVLHAMEFLRPGGSLSAIMSGGVVHNGDRLTTEFRRLVGNHGRIIQNPAGLFKESGTSVNTVTVIMRKAEDVAGSTIETAPIGQSPSNGDLFSQAA